MFPLIAPPEYYALTLEQKADICNGCGAKGSHLPIPDTIWGLDVREACNIHDFNYSEGRDKLHSDAVFVVNMVLLALFAFQAPKGWRRWLLLPARVVLLFLRIRRAITYGLAVMLFGDKAFRRETQ